MKFGKRGQESAGGGTLIMLLVLIVAAGLIAFFLYKFWVGGAAPLIDAQNPSMISAIQGCKADVAISGKEGYCNQFRKLTPSGAVAQYMTCRYIQEDLKYSVFTTDETISGKCENKRDIASAQCTELNRTHTADADTTDWTEYVDGIVCKKTGLA